jgi:molybdenum cofactor cytidylyltransferase
MIRPKSGPSIGAIVLAAGASKRLGFPKQLVVHQGQPLVRRMALAALDAGAGRVVVVLGAHAATIAPVLSELPWVLTVFNREWTKGLSSSLSVGLHAVFANPSCDAALVTLADQPFVDAAALRRLIKAFDDKHRIVASGYDDTLGVPALFGREFRGDLMQLTGDAGAGSWLRSRQNEVTRIPLRAAALDIDKSSDVARLTR